MRKYFIADCSSLQHIVVGNQETLSRDDSDLYFIKSCQGLIGFNKKISVLTNCFFCMLQLKLVNFFVCDQIRLVYKESIKEE